MFRLEACLFDERSFIDRVTIAVDGLLLHIQFMFLQMYADMIYKFGYVHCDPHAGNVLVRKNLRSGKDEIVLLDHGLYTVKTVLLS